MPYISSALLEIADHGVGVFSWERVITIRFVSSGLILKMDHKKTIFYKEVPLNRFSGSGLMRPEVVLHVQTIREVHGAAGAILLGKVGIG